MDEDVTQTAEAGNKMEATMPAIKLDAQQIETIIDKLMPIIAAPDDFGYFRGILRIMAENSTSGEFALFVRKLLPTNT